MEPKNFYDQTGKAFNQALDAVKASAKVVSEKAAEAAHITKFLIQKASVEHRIQKKLAELGEQVYRKESAAEGVSPAGGSAFKQLIEEIRSAYDELANIEVQLARERQKKNS